MHCSRSKNVQTLIFIFTISFLETNHDHMDVPGQGSEHRPHGALCFQFSYNGCLFLLSIISLLVLASGGLTVIIIFILKPRKPLFSLQTMNIVSYKFDVSESSSLLVSSVASVTLIAQNPNKVGIWYDFSRLHILHDGLVVGMIRIPKFYQPAQSHNVSIEIDIFFQCLDITKIMSGVEAHNFTIKVSGDLRVHLRLLQITLPKIKVCLDCDVAVDGRYLTSVNEISSLEAVENHIALFDANSQAFSKKCSTSFYLGIMNLPRDQTLLLEELVPRLTAMLELCPSETANGTSAFLVECFERFFTAGKPSATLLPNDELQ